MTEAMNELVRMINNLNTLTVALRPMAAFRDAMPPEWRARLADQGYVGSRCGWYPAKPKGWRP